MQRMERRAEDVEIEYVEHMGETPFTGYESGAPCFAISDPHERPSGFSEAMPIMTGAHCSLRCQDAEGQ